MNPMNPHPISVEVWKIKSFKIEKDDEHEDGRIVIQQKDGHTFAGMLVKDLFRTKEWHKIIPKIKTLYMAVHGGTCPLQIDVWYQNRWNTIWDRSNNFESFAEEKKSNDSYMNFIKKEGDKVAKLIDKGKTLKQIDKLMSDEHSGNTYGCSLNIGINKAKNKENSMKIRLEHNKKYGSDSKKGVVNPAILTIRAKK